MRRFLVALYPKRWRASHGDEYLALLEQMELTPPVVLDSVLQALRCRAREAWPAVMLGAPLLLASLAAAWLNLNANAVQYAAGALLAFSLVGAAVRPERWLVIGLTLAGAIPLSYIWADATRFPLPYHTPRLYETSVALVPALVGALCGRLLTLSWRRGSEQRGLE